MTATANSKVYDASTTAASVPTVTGGSLVSGDTATWTESYDSRHVGTGAGGTGRTLIPTGLIADGDGGKNYSVTWVNDTTTAAISQKQINVQAAPNTKLFDNNTLATAVPTIQAGSLSPGDTLAYTEYYTDANPGTGKTLLATGSVSDGNNGSDYQVTLLNNYQGDIIASQVAKFVVTATPTTVTAGNSFLLTVTAEDNLGDIVPTYAGTVHFTSGDPLEPVPAGNLTFQVGAGVASTLATLKTASASGWAITATDTVASTVSGTSSPVVVLAAAASTVAFPSTGEPTNTAAGATITAANSQPLVVNVDDAYGNLVTSYANSVKVAHFPPGPPRR